MVVTGHAISDVNALYFDLIEEIIKLIKGAFYWHIDVTNYKKYLFADKVELIEW